jgi:tetratricopeptide (TPR) repeat protein
MSENETDAPPPGAPQRDWGRLITRGILIALVVIVVPRLMRSHSVPPDQDYRIAWLDRYEGRLDQSIARFTALIKSDPNDARFYAERGEAYHLKHDTPRALADFAAAIERDPRSYDAFLYRCRLNRETGAIEGAIADCRQAADIKTDELEPRSLLGRMLLARGEIADAKVQLEAAIALQKEPFSGDDNRIYRGLIALFHENNPAAAADDFAAAHKRALARLGGLGLLDAPRLFGGDQQADLATVNYLVIWRHIARVRAGQDDAAEIAASLALLTDPVRHDWPLQHPVNENPTEARILAIALARWPARFIGLYAGKLTPADIRAAAAADGDAAARAQRACDAELYLGIYLADKGAREDAAKLLAAAAASCEAAPAQAGFAKAELARIQS